MVRLMLEKELEAKFRRRAEQAGIMVLKFVSPGHAGVPDRLALAPGGRACFVELKRPGGKLRPLQKFVIREIEALGFKVYVVDSEQDIEQFIKEVMPDAPYL